MNRGSKKKDNATGLVMSIKPREMKQVILKRMKVFGGNEHHLENGFVHEIFKQVPSTMKSNEALARQVLPLGPANCKPGGRTLDTQTASADLSLTSAALSCCCIPPLPMQSAYNPYLPGVVSTPNPLCIIAPLLHSQCPIDAESAEHLAASSCSPASPPNRQIPSLAPNIRPHEIWPPPPNAGLFFTHTSSHFPVSLLLNAELLQGLLPFINTPPLPPSTATPA